MARSSLSQERVSQITKLSGIHHSSFILLLTNPSYDVPYLESTKTWCHASKERMCCLMRYTLVDRRQDYFQSTSQKQKRKSARRQCRDHNNQLYQQPMYQSKDRQWWTNDWLIWEWLWYFIVMQLHMQITTLHHKLTSSMRNMNLNKRGLEKSSSRTQVVSS